MKTTIILFFFILQSLFVSCQDFWEEVILPDSITPASVCFNYESDIYLSSSQGLYKSTDGGNTWNLLLNYLAGLSTIVIESDEIFVGIDVWGNLFHSINDGISWDTVHTDIIGASLRLTSTNIMFSLDWGKIFKSEDFGQTWLPVYSTVNGEQFCDLIQKNDVLFTGSINYLNPNAGGVYHSLDSGNSWQQISLPGYGVSSFALDQDSNLLCGVRFQYYNQGYGVFRSYDFGFSWINILWGYIVTSLAVDINGGIYAGCDSDFGPEGVMFSPDNGLSWEQVNSGFHEDASVTSLSISPNGYIYATTVFPSKLYRSINPIVDIKEPPSIKSSFHLFPNPCNDFLNIRIKDESIHSSNSKLYIEIIDLSGKVLEIKSIELMGRCNISFNISSFQNGLYFVKLQSNLRVYTGRFIKY